MCSCLKCKSSITNPNANNPPFPITALVEICSGLFLNVILYLSKWKGKNCQTAHENTRNLSEPSLICWSHINYKHQWLSNSHILSLRYLLFIKEHWSSKDSCFSVFLLVYKFLYWELLHYIQGWQTQCCLDGNRRQIVGCSCSFLRLLLALICF